MPEDQDFSELPPPSAEELSALPPPQMTLGADGTPQYVIAPSDAAKSPRPVLAIDPVLKRKRLVTAFRPILALPLVIYGAFYGLAAFVVAFLSWWAALFTKRVPQGFASFLEGFVTFSSRLNAYMGLLTDKYPPLSGHSDAYPVRTRFVRAPLNRWAVLFRWAMLFPAYFLNSIVGAAQLLVYVVGWLFGVILGRTPESFYRASAIITRYSFRTYAYGFMLTGRYPVGPYGDAELPMQAFTQAAPVTTADGLPAYPVADLTAPRQPLTSTTVFHRTRGTLVVLIVGTIIGLGVQSYTQHFNFRTTDPVASDYSKLTPDRTAFNAAVSACSHDLDATTCLTPAAERYANKVNDYETTIETSPFVKGSIDNLTNILDQLVAELRHIPNTATRTEVRESITTVRGLESQLNSAVLSYQASGS